MTYVYYYTILALFSRYIVGYLLAERELVALAKQPVNESCARQGIEPNQLILHADRGSAMTSKTPALLLADLGVYRSHSCPYVSNDTPYSEAQFKTMKYRPDYPHRFGFLVVVKTSCLTVRVSGGWGEPVNEMAKTIGLNHAFWAAHTHLPTARTVRWSVN